MSVSAIGSISGTSSVTGAYTQLQKAQEKIATELAARADAARALADDRAAADRSQQAAQQAQALQAAQRAAEQQVLPMPPTPQQQSRPITASASALGGSFDVTV